MYNILKKIAKRLVPKKLLEKNESYLRNIISLRYKGKNHQCNICEYKLNRFVDLDGNDLLCPNCGSRCRTRRLYKELTTHDALEGNVLHFSPPKILYKKFKKSGINYFSSDFENEFAADYHYDITAIPLEESFFNIIICYHVLEHIEDDIKAMSELFRVLKPGGICYIQTPYNDGETVEDPSITSAQERKKHFGQEDHVRIYALKDLVHRLNKVGFKTQAKNYGNEIYNGLKKETIIFAKKEA